MTAADITTLAGRGFPLPASLTAAADTPWVPLSPGRSFKPIRFFSEDRGYVALMRVEAGVAIPPHRHTGEVHAFNLEGWRELCTGERVGPGDYVHEPAGNVDTWRASDDGAVVVLIVVSGAVEYLNADRSVAHRYSARTQEAAYRRHCETLGVAARDLTD